MPMHRYKRNHSELESEDVTSSVVSTTDSEADTEDDVDTDIEAEAEMLARFIDGRLSSASSADSIVTEKEDNEGRDLVLL